MTKPNKNPRLIRRKPPKFKYTAEPDAVNETTRASGVGPEKLAQRQAIAEEQRRVAETKQILRQLYRQRLSSQARANGQTDISSSLSDEAIDIAIMKELQQANQPQFVQDYNRLSDNYTTLSSFYQALGSPNIMPMSTEQVHANPYTAAKQIEFGSTNPSLLALELAAPTGVGVGATAAAKAGFIKGMKSAKPLVTRVLQGTGQAVKAGGKVLVQNPGKVSGNLLVQAVPMTAAAAEIESEDGQQGENGSVLPWIIWTGGALLGGKYLYSKLFKKGATPPKWFTLWESDPNTVAANTRYNTLATKYNTAFTAGDQAALDALKTELGKSPKEFIKKGKKNDDFISNTKLGEMIRDRTYPQPEGFIIESAGDKFWRKARNVGRVGLGITGGGYIAKGIYDYWPLISGQSTNEQPIDSTYIATDAAVEKGDTIRSIPRSTQPDSTATMQPVTGTITWDPNNQ